MNIVALTVMWIASGYFFLTFLSGVVELRRNKMRLGSQENLGFGRPHLGLKIANEFAVYYLVPCLNEELVIGRTVSGLVGYENGQVIVIDDGSDDRTGEEAVNAGGEQRVHLLTRRLPEARQGKGEALNAGLRLIRDLAEQRGQSPDKVIVCVMDADGRLSDGALSEVLPIFDDPRVGGVQLAVRIRNRESFLTRFQDYQFWGLAAVMQFGRNRSASVSMGGNGQFARLSALNELGSRPWSGSLTEDLDLGISLAINGWRLRTAFGAAVDQQAVRTVTALVRQRTRWYQGHMMAARRAPDIWRSKNTSHPQAVEMVAYVAVPWLIDLPWSILWQFCVVQQVLHVDDMVNGVTGGVPGWIITLSLWYAFSFGPTLFAASAYLRRDRKVGLWNALVLSHAYLVMNYVFFLCAWRAVGRIFAGRHGWDKTKRVSEASTGAEASSSGNAKVPTVVGLNGSGEPIA